MPSKKCSATRKPTWQLLVAIAICWPREKGGSNPPHKRIATTSISMLHWASEMTDCDFNLATA